MLSAKHFLLILPLLSHWPPLLPAAHAADDLSFGPLFDRFELTLEPGHRTEALGPLYYHQVTEDQTQLWASPPIFSYSLNEDVDYESLDFLWKGITYTRYGEEYRFQILQLFSFAGGGTQSETNVHRFTLFPIYFQQRSELPGMDYTALVPIYGHINKRLFRDEIKFVLFPLYGQSRKRDVVTDNYLYPIFHLRRGDGLQGWQIWPLFGTESKEVTTRSNDWGDLELKGGHQKLFVLWPFFHDHHLGLGTTNPVHQQALIPFYSYLRSPARDSTSYLWPLGVTHTVDREKKFNEWGAPWPLVVFTRGEGKTVNRVWPFFSQARNRYLSSSWYVWPIYKKNRLHSDPLDRERTRILFFLYSDLSVRNTETKKSLRRRDFWPLFTFKKDFEGATRLQVLSLLEPFLPNNPSVDRNLSPLWSLWHSEENPTRAASSQSLLWNLYRRDVQQEHRKCSLLFGLFQYHSDPDGRRWRVFYIPFGHSKRTEKPTAR